MWQSERKNISLKKRLLEDQNYQGSDSESETEGLMHEEAYHVKPHRFQPFLSNVSFMPSIFAMTSRCAPQHALHLMS